VLYVLDEPSIGLHPRDNQRLLDTLTALRDMAIRCSWWSTMPRRSSAPIMCSIWVRRGRLGGELVASGTPDAIRLCAASLTGQYLAGTREIPLPKQRRAGNGESIRITAATEHNLKASTWSFRWAGSSW